MNIEDILKLRSEGKTLEAIAAVYGVTKQAIHQRIEVYKMFKSKRDLLRQELNQ